MNRQKRVMSPKWMQSLLLFLYHKPLYLILFYGLISNLVNCLTLLNTAIEQNTSLKSKCPSAPLLIPWPESQWNDTSDGSPNESAINHLLRVLGMERNHLERKRRHNSVPQYMLNLYSMALNTQNDRTINLKHNSKIVRSVGLTHTQSSHFHYYFNISGVIPSNEHVLEAEFHIYKLKYLLKTAEKLKDPKHHLLEVRVYQILSEGKNDSDVKKRLLDVRRMSTHSFGWDVFYVKQAVKDWIKRQNSNYGLLITVITMLKENMKNGIRFANRYQHHINKQPFLVIFSTDSKVENSSISSSKIDNNNYDYGFSELSRNRNRTDEEIRTKTVDLSHKKLSDSLSLSHLISSYSSFIPMNTCSRHDLYVDFESIGWSAWIISPKGYNAFYCKGDCIYPLSQSDFAKDHVQSIPHNWSANHVKSCCAPNKLNPLNVLYFDERANIVLKRYDDMLIDNCVCN